MNYQVTGNEYISLPTLRESDGAAEGVTFLYMQVKGLLELRGKAGLIRPYMEAEGQRLPLHPKWTREHCWIPGFTSEERTLRFSCVYLTPIGERGFMVRLVLENTGDTPQQVRFGVEGEWSQTLHEINETTELNAGREAYESGWNHMFIFSQKPGLPLFAFAPCVADPQQFAQIDQHAEWTRDGFAYDIYRTLILQPGKKAVLDIPWGVGYDGVAAATSAKELLRQGFEAVHERTVRWLAAREKRLADSSLSKILNTNLFFAFFYASGRTIDTEELCLMTSRSPRYYVSAAYWDRDSLLWAFPAILTVDVAYAREILTYNRKYNSLAERFHKAADRVKEIDAECARRKGQRREIETFRDAVLANDQPVTVFSTELWNATIDRMTVKLDGSVKVTFRNGIEITV